MAGIFLLAVSGVFTGATAVCVVYVGRYARRAEDAAERAEAAHQQMRTLRGHP